MTFEVWPDSLPSPSDYAFETRERRRRNPTGASAPRTFLRTFARDPVVDAQVRWRLSASDLKTFDTWYTATLALGMKRFLIPLPGEGGWVARVARFIGAPRLTHVETGIFDVAATLEVREAIPTPEVPPASSHWDDVVLLMHLDGEDLSTTFTDSSQYAHSFSRFGSTTYIRTDQKKFGTGSLRVSSTFNGIETAASNDWAFGTGDFTIELWVWRDTETINLGYVLIEKYPDWQLALSLDASVGLDFAIAGSIVSSYTWTPTAQIWYHVAACRVGTTLRTFIDGVQVASVTDSSDIVSTPGNTLYFPLKNGSGDPAIRIDEVRITKGFGWYNANFTPPTEAFSEGP
jgi:Concanavalin A-like lectin/glucanases superfamily